MKQKQKQLNETNKAQDIDEELAAVRKEHVKLIGEQGQMVALEKVGDASLPSACTPDEETGA